MLIFITLICKDQLKLNQALCGYAVNKKHEKKKKKTYLPRLDHCILEIIILIHLIS